MLLANYAMELLQIETCNIYTVMTNRAKTKLQMTMGKDISPAFAIRVAC